MYADEGFGNSMIRAQSTTTRLLLSAPASTKATYSVPFVTDDYQQIDENRALAHHEHMLLLQQFQSKNGIYLLPRFSFFLLIISLWISFKILLRKIVKTSTDSI